MSITFKRTQAAVPTGIVHLGIGAFFRAHGAIYLKEVVEKSGGDWGIVGVSLRSPAVRDKLSTHDYLYTAVEVSKEGIQAQLIDIVSNVLVAPENPDAVLQVMASPKTTIVSMTVTEKGYCRGENNGSIDLNHPDIKHDIKNILPRSAPGFIVRALEIRKQQGIRPFTVLCMDNLSSNGDLTKRIIIELAKQIDRELALWIEQECTFPNTMVDRIVPATTLEFLSRLKQECHIEDTAAVSHEPFRQWVIEDNFVDNVRPSLDTVGVQLVDDVKPFEDMKLRMLNGTHSALAYVGSQLGHETVNEAINDTNIASFIDSLWNDEIAPSLTSPPNVNLSEYAQQLKERYQNPEIHHRLEQIAMDGSEKLPQRIFDTLFENIEAGIPHQRLLMVVAAWFSYIELRTTQSDSSRLDDPLRDVLIKTVQSSATANEYVSNMLGIESLFGRYPTQVIRDDLASTFQQIKAHGLSQSIKELNQ